MKTYEKEKEFMKSLKAVSVTTSYCGTAGSESEESGDSANSEDELSEPDDYMFNLPDSSDDDESSDEVTDSPSPLYFHCTLQILAPIAPYRKENMADVEEQLLLWALLVIILRRRRRWRNLKRRRKRFWV